MKAILIFTNVHYVEQAYKQKKWAYVSDYARMKILDLYGGIYFDTDVEVIKRFPEELREHSFSGIEEFSKLVAPGLVYGCESGDIIVHEMVNEYEHTKFDNLRIEDIITINKRITRILDRYGYVHEDHIPRFRGVKSVSERILCAYDGKKKKDEYYRPIRWQRITIQRAGLPWYRKDQAYHRNKIETRWSDKMTIFLGWTISAFSF